MEETTVNNDLSLMPFAANLLIVVATFVLMEGVAWFSHKYVMHGMLWSLHEDHHIPQKGFFEKNDFFFLIFGIPGFLLLLLGSIYQHSLMLSVGAGISLYGVAYFMVHEVFIHQRFKWFRNSNNFYLRAIRRAHKVHHKHLSKEEGECFGMLWVPLKYFKESKKQLKPVQAK
jgi:beta-carotene 3-hydroxylase